MIAYIGVPGETGRKWRRFGPRELREAETWLEGHLQARLAQDPFRSLPAWGTLPEKEARRVKFLDGTRAYPAQCSGSDCPCVGGYHGGPL